MDHFHNTVIFLIIALCPLLRAGSLGAMPRPRSLVAKRQLQLELDHDYSYSQFITDFVICLSNNLINSRCQGLWYSRKSLATEFQRKIFFVTYFPNHQTMTAMKTMSAMGTKSAMETMSVVKMSQNRLTSPKFELDKKWVFYFFSKIFFASDSLVHIKWGS